MNQQITCPNCAHTFALDEAFNREIELDLRQKLTAEFEKKQAETVRLAKEEAQEQSARAREALQVKIDAQSKELKEARKQEMTLLRAKEELQRQAEKAALEARRTLDQERDKIRKEAQQVVIEQHQLSDADKNKQLDALRRQIEELKRKAEQGSQQLQGDVQELELEKALREHFPRDVIKPVQTGAKGADIVQRVMDDDGKVCGTILWESKRVKNWNDGFIDKLLRDKSDAKADLAVIVTDALPNHITHMGCVKGVLLTTFSLAICLASTLRVNMALLGHARIALGGQDDQKTRLFEYFMSPRFHDKMGMIADQLNQMQEDLRKERTSITRGWGKREKQIEMVMSGTAGVVGTLQAFYGPSLPLIPQFELPEGDPK